MTPRSRTSADGASDPTGSAAAAADLDPSVGGSAAAGVADLTYEQARDELMDVVRRLEEGGASLEESLALWERGEALAARCQSWLDGARRRLDDARAATDADDA